METIFEFNGKHTDRTDIDFHFDGMKIILWAEHMDSSNLWHKIEFDDVMYFEFENDRTVINYDSEYYEKMVKYSAESYTEPRKSRFNVLFDETTSSYKVLLNDIGFLHVIAKSCHIGEPVEMKFKH